jgi:hypothetical protein
MMYQEAYVWPGHSGLAIGCLMNIYEKVDVLEKVSGWCVRWHGVRWLTNGQLSVVGLKGITLCQTWLAQCCASPHAY